MRTNALHNSCHQVMGLHKSMPRASNGASALMKSSARLMAGLLRRDPPGDRELGTHKMPAYICSPAANILLENLPGGPPLLRAPLVPSPIQRLAAT
jgi:hypothetical protein